MQPNVIPASEAQTRLFELLKRAKAGESFLITLDGDEAARLAPLVSPSSLIDRAALVTRIDEARKGAQFNPPGSEKVSIRQWLEEGRR